MWATNYRTDNNVTNSFPGILTDGRLFTDYNADSKMNENLKRTNNIKTNSDYRRFLVQNTNTIMNYNFNNMILENRTPNPTGNVPSYGSPYLFKGIDDNTIPYGYESSYPKMIYLSRQQLDDKKRRPIQNDFQ
jgi:hypothetical protein